MVIFFKNIILAIYLHILRAIESLYIGILLFQTLALQIQNEIDQIPFYLILFFCARVKNLVFIRTQK